MPDTCGSARNRYGDIVHSRCPPAPGRAPPPPADAARPLKGSVATTKVNPAIEFCNALDGLAIRISECTSEAEVERELESMDKANRDLDESYRLKPSDRTAIKKSLNGMFRAIVMKAAQLQGIDASDKADMFNGIVDAVVDKSDTLGELGDNMDAMTGSMQ